jgi:hypothetical protein
MIDKLISLATALDKAGLTKEADYLDRIILKMAEEPAYGSVSGDDDGGNDDDFSDIEYTGGDEDLKPWDAGYKDKKDEEAEDWDRTMEVEREGPRPTKSDMEKLVLLATRLIYKYQNEWDSTQSDPFVDAMGGKQRQGRSWLINTGAMGAAELFKDSQANIDHDLAVGRDYNTPVTFILNNYNGSLSFEGAKRKECEDYAETCGWLTPESWAKITQHKEQFKAQAKQRLAVDLKAAAAKGQINPNLVPQAVALLMPV